MRTLILLIVISAFLIWFGVSFQQTRGKAARISLIIGIIMAIFVLIGVFRLV